MTPFQTSSVETLGREEALERFLNGPMAISEPWRPSHVVNTSLMTQSTRSSVLTLKFSQLPAKVKVWDSEPWLNSGFSPLSPPSPNLRVQSLAPE